MIITHYKHSRYGSIHSLRCYHHYKQPTYKNDPKRPPQRVFRNFLDKYSTNQNKMWCIRKSTRFHVFCACSKKKLLKKSCQWVSVHENAPCTKGLMYVARMTRPDILFAVSYLATKSSHPKPFSET